MKKLVSLLIGTMFVFSIAGCSINNSTPDASESPIESPASNNNSTSTPSNVTTQDPPPEIDIPASSSPTESTPEIKADNPPESENDVPPSPTENSPQGTDKPKPSPIRLSDYINVSFSGYNLAGHASVSFDKEKFLLDNINLITFNENNLPVYRELYGNDSKSPANALCSFFGPKISNWKRLSNGDSVEVVWDFYEEKISTYFVCDLDFSAKQFVVDGLTEATTYDPFDSVKIVFSSIAPYGKAGVYPYDEHNRDRYNGTYSTAPSEGLTNGDLVTVTYSCDDTYDMIAMYGTYPSVYEKTYTVSGLKAFPTRIEDFSDSVLASVDVAASNYFSNFMRDTSYGMIVESYAVEGYAFIVPTVNIGYDDSRFYAIYNVKARAVYEDQSQETQYYVMFEFNNPIIENGICSMHTNNYRKASHSTNNIAFAAEANSIVYVRTDGFNTKDEITEYLNSYISSRSKLLFQTYNN